MSVRLYMDEHVARSITLGLRQRGVDVITAQEDGRSGASDVALLDRATELRRALFTQDDDLLAEGHRRQSAGVPFGGVVYAHQLRVTIGGLVADLSLVAEKRRMRVDLDEVFHASGRCCVRGDGKACSVERGGQRRADRAGLVVPGVCVEQPRLPKPLEIDRSAWRRSVMGTVAIGIGRGSRGSLVSSNR